MPRQVAWHEALRSTVSAWVSGTDWIKESAYVALLPHVEAAYKRGHEAGSSQAGYRLVQENERLRRELELARREKNGGGVCPSCLSALGATGSTRASAGEPPEGSAP
ncbi:hypothetical protein ACF1BE_18740 [Streptomyces sp. NPDC014991]|uniref:hypothetical protein n=1 Tax=Streptomyces sp. NPDC014991 TaxID=3364935 RepID=UPI0036FF2F65